MTSTSEKGRRAEDLAVQALDAHGYTVHERNWRCEAGEIDIVASKQDMIVFVEVKARTGTSHGTPEEAVTPEKRERLLKAGQVYLAEHDRSEAAWRIDVIALRFASSGRVTRLDIYPDAVQAGWGG